MDFIDINLIIISIDIEDEDYVDGVCLKLKRKLLKFSFKNLVVMCFLC